MITVRQTPYISLIDVCRELEMHVRDFEFAYHANNDSFVTLGLTDADVEDLSQVVFMQPIKSWELIEIV